MDSISKTTAVEKFSEIYLTLTDAKRANFAKLCERLLDENFIYGQIDSDKNDYYNILSMKDLIEYYFLIINFQLNHDDTRKILFLESIEERNRIKFRKLETVIIVLLRKFYYIKSKEELNSNTNITITFDDLVDAINETGIFKDELKRQHLIEALKKIKKLKLINVDVYNFEVNNIIEIYPMITIIVNINDLDLINNKLKAYINRTGVVEDEIDED